MSGIERVLFHHMTQKGESFQKNPFCITSIPYHTKGIPGNAILFFNITDTKAVWSDMCTNDRSDTCYEYRILYACFFKLGMGQCRECRGRRRPAVGGRIRRSETERRAGVVRGREAPF